jgi:hypothetical protein
VIAKKEIREEDYKKTETRCCSNTDFLRCM